MKKNLKRAAAIGLASLMMAGTAFAGTMEENTYDAITDLGQYLNDKNSLKTYPGFEEDRSQAVLVDKDWKYRKDDGTYAVSEWVQDDAGKSYYISASGTTLQGYAAPGEVDENAYFFEPSDGHRIEDAILGVNAIGGWDIDYTVNADGTWDMIPWEGYNPSVFESSLYSYFDENGKMVSNAAIPGGTAVANHVQDVKREVDENGVPFLMVGDVRYVAEKCSSWDRTYEQDMGGAVVKAGYHEFYTVYVRQK